MDLAARASSVILLILFLGCMDLMPVHYGISGTTAHPRSNQDAVVSAVKKEYLRKYSRNSEFMDQAFNIHWSDEICPGGEHTAVVFGDKCYAGWTNNDCSLIIVAWRDPSIPYSALVHELGHCWKILDSGDGDAEHTDSAFWRFNSSVNARIKEWID